VGPVEVQTAFIGATGARFRIHRGRRV